LPSCHVPIRKNCRKNDSALGEDLTFTRERTKTAPNRCAVELAAMAISKRSIEFGKPRPVPASSGSTKIALRRSAHRNQRSQHETPPISPSDRVTAKSRLCQFRHLLRALLSRLASDCVCFFFTNKNSSRRLSLTLRMHLVVDNSKRLGHAGNGKKIILADEVACKKSVKVQGDEKRTHEKNESNTGFVSNRIVPERHQEGRFINLVIDFSEIKRVKIRYRVFRYKKQKGELQWNTVHTRK